MFLGSVERPPRLSEFQLVVPEKLIAQHPSKKREECIFWWNQCKLNLQEKISKKIKL